MGATVAPAATAATNGSGDVAADAAAATVVSANSSVAVAVSLVGGCAKCDDAVGVPPVSVCGDDEALVSCPDCGAGFVIEGLLFKWVLTEQMGDTYISY